MTADALDLAQPFIPEAGHRAEMGRLIGDGLLRRVTGRVLVRSDVPDTLALRARAVRLALTPPERRSSDEVIDRGVVGFRTAAWVHAGGDCGPENSGIALVSAPGPHRPRLRGAVVHEHRLGPRDVETMCGVRLTTPVRTAADLVRTVPGEEALVALDRLRITCGVRVIDVVEQFDRMPRCRGVARGRRLLHAWATSLASVSLG
ncbi:MAG: hypothetical protein U0Q19_21495 [Kineosporiaceae bacterium]